VLNMFDEAHRGSVIRWRPSRGRRAKVPALAGTRAGREPAALLPGGLSSAIHRATSFSVTCLHLREDLSRREKGFAHERRAHLAGEVQEHFRQLLLGPPLPQRHAEVNRQFGLRPGCGIRDHAE
jgi:hypothetical protein